MTKFAAPASTQASKGIQHSLPYLLLFWPIHELREMAALNRASRGKVEPTRIERVHDVWIRCFCICDIIAIAAFVGMVLWIGAHALWPHLLKPSPLLAVSVLLASTIANIVSFLVISDLQDSSDDMERGVMTQSEFFGGVSFGDMLLLLRMFFWNILLWAMLYTCCWWALKLRALSDKSGMHHGGQYEIGDRGAEALHAWSAGFLFLMTTAFAAIGFYLGSKPLLIASAISLVLYLIISMLPYAKGKDTDSRAWG